MEQFYFPLGMIAAGIILAFSNILITFIFNERRAVSLVLVHLIAGLLYIGGILYLIFTVIKYFVEK